MEKRVFTILENNPETVNQLAHSIGLSTEFAFYDVYSLTDPDLLALIPRPVYALLTIIPMTPSWRASRQAEDNDLSIYQGFGEDEPIIWFKQTIINGCGSVGVLHCTLNSGAGYPAPPMITSGNTLARLKNEALPLKIMDRAQLLNDNDELYEAHEAAAQRGDTPAPDKTDLHAGEHFVAFVKGKDGHLYELEGSRKGPLDRGALSDDQDLLSQQAIGLGLGRLIEQEKRYGNGDMRFSCIALARKREN